MGLKSPAPEWLLTHTFSFFLPSPTLLFLRQGLFVYFKLDRTFSIEFVIQLPQPQEHWDGKGMPINYTFLDKIVHAESQE